MWDTDGTDIWYNSGNVGIGTSDPKFTLDIAGTGNGKGIRFDGGHAFITVHDGHGNFNFLSGINDDNIITGTTPYGTRLEMSDDNGYFDLETYTGNPGATGIKAGHLYLGTSKAYFDNVKVGIGTTDPQYALDIAGYDDGKGIRFDNGHAFITTHDGYGNFNLLSGIDDDNLIVANSNGTRLEMSHSGFFDFETYTGDVGTAGVKAGHLYIGTNKAYFDNVKVGIGTTTPEYKLHVVGDESQFDGNLFVNGDFELEGTSDRVFWINDRVAISKSVNDLVLNSEGDFARTVINGGNLDLSDRNIENVDRISLMSLYSSPSLYDRKMLSFGQDGDYLEVIGNLAISSGKVGIGTTDPQYALDIAGSADGKGIRFDGGHSFITTHDDYGNFNLLSGIDDDNLIVANSNGTRLEMSHSGFFDFETYTGDVGTAGVKAGHLYIGTNKAYFDNVKVGIGTTSPGEMLSVNGKIEAKEVMVKTDVVPDYVFKDNYNLMPLKDLEKFIKVNKHLPEVPSEKDVKQNGGTISLGEMNTILLKKIEELTLYIINQNETTMEQQNQIDNMKREIGKLIVDGK
ncbi:hypothetical protein ACFLSE_07585 [Bacteroidota bacterium]